MNQNTTSFSSVLQQLCSDHFNRVITTEEYKIKRRKILDQIDVYYNGNHKVAVNMTANIAESSDDKTQKRPRQDVTVPNPRRNDS